MAYKDRVYKYTTPSLSLSNATANTTAINNALSTNKGTDNAVYIPAGRWPYNGIITIDSAMLFGEGTDSILYEITGQASPNVPIQLQGYRPQLRWIVIEQHATVRSSASGVDVNPGALGHVIDGVTSQGAAGAAFDIQGANYGCIFNCVALNSLADGCIHTNKSQNCEVDGLISTGVGDDYCSVVSYQADGGKCNNIQIRGVVGTLQQTSGRGLTVVGGDNITYDGCTVTNTRKFGIYVFAESSFNTYGCTNITVKNCAVNGTGYQQAVPANWDGFLVGTDNAQSINTVTTANVKITQAVGAPKTRTAGNTSNIDFSGVS